MLRIALAALAAALFCSPVFADGYVTAFGGGGIGPDFEGAGAKASFNSDSGTSGVAGIAVGTHIAPNLRAELEASWRTATLAGAWTVCGNETPLDGGDETFAAMANLAYEVPLGSSITAHAIVGAGFGSRRIVLEPTPDNWETTSTGANEHGFVWQIGAGADYALSQKTRIGLAYRYFTGPSIDRVVIVDGKSAFFEASGDHHALIATASFAFD